MILESSISQALAASLADNGWFHKFPEPMAMTLGNKVTFVSELINLFKSDATVKGLTD